MQEKNHDQEKILRGEEINNDMGCEWCAREGVPWRAEKEGMPSGMAKRETGNVLTIHILTIISPTAVIKESVKNNGGTAYIW
jgi:hypothetical protein